MDRTCLLFLVRVYCYVHGRYYFHFENDCVDFEETGRWGIFFGEAEGDEKAIFSPLILKRKNSVTTAEIC